MNARRQLTLGGSLAAILVLTFISFSPILGNQFVNWDDPERIVNNPHLLDPGIVGWAFTATQMSHHQPLSWLTWWAIARTFGLQPGAFHAVSLAGHLLNALLVFFLARSLAKAAGAQAEGVAGLSVTAALLFAIHPLRVETVAWASAFSYVLSLTFLLLSAIAYSSWAGAPATERRDPRHADLRQPWLFLSIACYALSLLSRPLAFAFPFVLMALDVYPLRLVQSGKLASRNHVRSHREQLLAKLPFFLLAGIAVAVESGARPLESIAEYGVGARLSAAVTAPFLYLLRTAWPVGLTPLDPLPLDPHADVAKLALGAAGLAIVTLLAFRFVKRAPAPLVGWVCYLLLLAPAVGLTPSGLQATADRYTYIPGVALAIAAGAATSVLWRSSRGRVLGAAGLAVLSLALGMATRQQVHWWRDSVSLWTRAAELDPTNDVALYNLGIALADAGDEAGAIARYQQTLRLIPEHGPARHNLRLLEAARYEREGHELASKGRLARAIEAYRAALDRDPERRAARVNLGMAALQLGQLQPALTELDAAWRAGARDPSVANALAYAAIQSGREAYARQVLEQALLVRPDDINTRHNLARLLATASDRSVRDGDKAVELALSVTGRRGDRDPKALDTLGAAYAQAGRLAQSRETFARAVELALTSGDRELASEIEAHQRLYTKRD